MWLAFAFLSATLLGFYDVFKKQSLKNNAVIPVLFLNTLFCSLIFLPFIILSACGSSLMEGSMFYVPQVGWESHQYIVLKSCIVLSSWILGYFGIKHLPITLVGPINATRPVMVLIGAMLVFGERLNLYQWIGVLLAIFSFFLLSRSGKKEGIDFKQNRWVFAIVGAAVLGAVSGLYDKYIISAHALHPLFVQSWFGVYQLLMMCVVACLLWLPRRKDESFVWRWTIPLITIFVSCADFFYYHALDDPDAMIAVVSMIRRSSVIVTFICGVLLFGERNVRSKVIDLILILIGMVLLAIGSI